MGRHRKRSAVAFVLSMLAPEVAWGQTPPAPLAPAATPADALTPPALRTRSEAPYPSDALRDGIEGTVGIELSIDETGHVTAARVTAPAGYGFDEAAVAAARAFTFEPARRSGVAIPSTVQFAYEFHLPPPPAAPPVAAPVAAPTVAAPPPSPPVQVDASQTTLVVAQQPLSAPAPRNAASDSSTAQAELSLRPMFRAEGLLEVVPGLFSVQHAGGGKAQQDFARGFNLDHGTDMAFFVDDAPINADSHAHGQGYSDFHFLIPETVERVDSTKGTYAANVGDFGTAGSVNFHLTDHTHESVAKAEFAPSTGHVRFVAVESPDLGEKWRAAVAVEAFHENGPFIHPENFGRLNAYAKVTRVLDERSELSFMALVRF